MRKMKFLTKAVSALVSAILILSLSAFASPDTVSPYEEGTATDLIAVTKPEGQKASTFDSTYIISGYGKENTVITLYWHNMAEDMYQKIYNKVEYTEADGKVTAKYEEATVTVGASGLFMNTVEPAEGDNNILIRAENGENVQYIKLSITRYKRNLLGIIKALTD